MTDGYRVMGVVNVTPDSFSDGGEFLAADDAVAHARMLAADGADILDIGGESTRPGADPVSEEEELRRVLPVLERIAASPPTPPQLGTPAQISIDTAKARVAHAALVAGASLVNDVTAFRAEPEIAGIVADAGADCCLMHMRGAPRTMQDDPQYEDVVDEVRAFLEQRMEFAIGEGVLPERILLDPGIGFGKTVEHNLELLRGLPALASIGRPIVVGTSRKTFLGRLVASARRSEEPAGVQQRLAATIATNVLAYERGASVFRVHDVGPVRDALAVAAATFGRQWQASGQARTRTS